MTTVTTYDEVTRPATDQQEPDDDKCTVCHRNPVYIGTMCRPCYEERAYPDREPPPAPPQRGRMTSKRYTDEEIARVVHATFREMQAVCRDELPAPPWESMTAEDRRTAVQGVRRVRLSGMSARENHENWFRAKALLGWRYGPKNAENRTHPGMVPWDELCQPLRDRAELFAGMVWSLTRKGKEEECT